MEFSSRSVQKIKDSEEERVLENIYKAIEFYKNEEIDIKHKAVRDIVNIDSR